MVSGSGNGQVEVQSSAFLIPGSVHRVPDGYRFVIMSHAHRRPLGPLMRPSEMASLPCWARLSSQIIRADGPSVM
jgi:hypothetical protein